MSWKGFQPSRPFYDSKHFHANPPRTANLLPFSRVGARYIVPSSIGDPPRLPDREPVLSRRLSEAGRAAAPRQKTPPIRIHTLQPSVPPARATVQLVRCFPVLSMPNVPFVSSGIHLHL